MLVYALHQAKVSQVKGVYQPVALKNCTAFYTLSCEALREPFFKYTPFSFAGKELSTQKARTF